MSCAWCWWSNHHQLQDYYITEIMRLLGSVWSSCRLIMALLSCFCLRSRGKQVHFVWAAPVAQRLLQLQKVLRVSGWPRFPDEQRGHPLPRLWQRHLSGSPSWKRVCPSWLPSEKQQHNSSNLTFVALCASFIGFWQINQFLLLGCFLHALTILFLYEWDEAFIPKCRFSTLENTLMTGNNSNTIVFQVSKS